jgi:hypothetical protein
MDSADNTLKSKLHDIIFGYETLAGKLFDVVLISLIAISVIAVMLDSVSHIHAAYGPAIVGYGDIAPHTPLGQAVAALAMIVGYGIIAVPTGIVGAELFTEQRRQDAPAQIARTCQGCELATHEADAAFCKRCGCNL